MTAAREAALEAFWKFAISDQPDDGKHQMDGAVLAAIDAYEAHRTAELEPTEKLVAEMRHAAEHIRQGKAIEEVTSALIDIWADKLEPLTEIKP